jgi:hypothetical protein
MSNVPDLSPLADETQTSGELTAVVAVTIGDLTQVAPHTIPPAPIG